MTFLHFSLKLLEITLYYLKIPQIKLSDKVLLSDKVGF